MAYIEDLKGLVDQGIVAEDVTITMNSCLCAAVPENVPTLGQPGYQENTVKWADLNKGTDRNSVNNIARAISEALPNATIIASKHRVNSQFGITDKGRVIYQGGKEVILNQQQVPSPDPPPDPPQPDVPAVNPAGPTTP